MRCPCHRRRPGGLTAAIYLARFHLRTIVVDAGNSRAGTIPRTRNHAGYPGGIVGADLVEAMHAQTIENGAVIISHAMGEGGVAATTLRNDLAEGNPIYR